MREQTEGLQEVYEVGDGQVATRLAVLENEVNSLKRQLAQAQQQVGQPCSVLNISFHTRVLRMASLVCSSLTKAVTKF